VTFLQRYLAGDREDVWRELYTLGARVREPEFIADATAVAAETMRRARTDLERLITLLPESGWRFAYPSSGPRDKFAVWNPPATDTPDLLAKLEDQLAGPIPLSLTAWWTIVGSVCLMRPPRSVGEVSYPDPLVIAPVEHVISELDEWLSDESFREAKPKFAAPIAPDALHKEDVSGGPPYEAELPDPAADALLRNFDKAVTFVGYLRLAFTWAGLPGYAEVFDEPPSWITEIAASLVPL
jgi:hypothetical protein